MPKARAAAEEALRLEPDLPEGHLTRAIVAFLYDWDWRLAESHILRALELRPAHSLAHAWHAVMLMARRPEDGLARIHHAVELDPFALPIISLLGLAYYFARRFDEAVARHRAVLEMDPDQPRIQAWLIRSLIAAGRTAEGLETAERALSRMGRDPRLLESYGRLLGLVGRRAEAIAVLEELRSMGATRYVSPWQEAGVHLGLGELAEAGRCYRRAVEQRSGRVLWMAREPLLDPVRREPWFAGLLSRVGLEEPAFAPSLAPSAAPAHIAHIPQQDPSR
jgi:serine/threonine-protein kinase